MGVGHCFGHWHNWTRWRSGFENLMGLDCCASVGFSILDEENGGSVFMYKKTVAWWREAGHHRYKCIFHCWCMSLITSVSVFWFSGLLYPISLSTMSRLGTLLSLLEARATHLVVFLQGILRSCPGGMISVEMSLPSQPEKGAWISLNIGMWGLFITSYFNAKNKQAFLVWPYIEYFVYCANGECRPCHFDIDMGGEDSPGTTMSRSLQWCSMLPTTGVVLSPGDIYVRAFSTHNQHYIFVVNLQKGKTVTPNQNTTETTIKGAHPTNIMCWISLHSETKGYAHIISTMALARTGLQVVC